MLDLIDRGGPFAIALLALAFIGVLFSLERFFFFHRARINAGDLLIGLAAHLRRKAFAEALHEASRAPGPVARVCHSILVRHSVPRSDLAAIAKEAGQLEVPRMERNLRMILAIATIAPLIGLLGTILGLAETFERLNQQSNVTTTNDLFSGVFEALVTTALGLIVAIPMYLLYLFFYSRAQRLIHRIERAAIELVNLVYDAHADGEIVEFAAEKQQQSKATAKATDKGKTKPKPTAKKDQ